MLCESRRASRRNGGCWNSSAAAGRLRVAKAAAERGIHTFSASYLAENLPVAALVEDAGGRPHDVCPVGAGWRRIQRYH